MGILLHGRYSVFNKQLQRGNTIDASKKKAVSVASVDDSSVCLETSSFILHCFYSWSLIQPIFFSNFFFSKRGLWYIKKSNGRLESLCESMGKIEEYKIKKIASLLPFFSSHSTILIIFLSFKVGVGLCCLRG